jgi:hypothetical protein
MIKVDFKNIGKALNDINKKMLKMEDIATTRSLNQILMEERTKIAGEVSKEYGVLKGSAKKKIIPKKATKDNKEISLFISSARTNLGQPKQIKGGISFRKKGGGRKKIKVAIKTGSSKPFLIKARAGGSEGDFLKLRGGTKKIPVYVAKENNKYRDIEQRKTTTMRGSSLKHMVESIFLDASRLLDKAVRKKFSKIYPKQLEKAKFTGSR